MKQFIYDVLIKRIDYNLLKELFKGQIIIWCSVFEMNSEHPRYNRLEVIELILLLRLELQIIEIIGEL